MPLRKCIYCHRMSAKLTRHIQTRLKDVQRVKDALVMKKERRTIEFQKIQREEIRLCNEREASKKHPVFLGEQKQKKYKNLLNAVHVWPFYRKGFLVYIKRVAG